MLTTDMSISNWARQGVAQGARAMLVVWDTLLWPPQPCPLFIAAGEDIGVQFAEVDGVGMQRE